MPVYEYECPTHGLFEVIDRIVDRDTVKFCPGTDCTCSRRVVSRSDFRIDGAPPRGWKPLVKSKPKSYVPVAHRKVSE